VRDDVASLKGAVSDAAANTVTVRLASATVGVAGTVEVRRETHPLSRASEA